MNTIQKLYKQTQTQATAAGVIAVFPKSTLQLGKTAFIALYSASQASIIKKASRINSIIKEKIKTYKKAWGVIDGYYNHNRRNKQSTVFSKLFRIKRLVEVNKIDKLKPTETSAPKI